MKAIRTAQVHLDEVRMVLEVIEHVGSEFERAAVVADLAEDAFSQFVGVADLAEEQGERRGHRMSGRIAVSNVMIEDILAVNMLCRERDHGKREVSSRFPCLSRRSHA